MSADSWQCIRCHKLHIRLPDGKRGSVGHWPDVCAACSMDEAETDMLSVPMSVQWLVARLRTELSQERAERANDLAGSWYH